MTRNLCFKSYENASNKSVQMLSKSHCLECKDTVPLIHNFYVFQRLRQYLSSMFVYFAVTVAVVCQVLKIPQKARSITRVGRGCPQDASVAPQTVQPGNSAPSQAWPRTFPDHGSRPSVVTVRTSVCTVPRLCCTSHCGTRTLFSVPVSPQQMVTRLSKNSLADSLRHHSHKTSLSQFWLQDSLSLQLNGDCTVL